MGHLQHETFRKTSRPKAMSVSVPGERAEEEQNATLALLEARSREELAKALLGIALQRSRASAGTVLFSENGRFVPFATSIWVKNAVRDVRFSSSRFPLDIGAFEHAARTPDPISMNEVLSRFDGIELSVLWIPLRYQGDIVGLIYLEADRAGSFGATSIESVSAIAIQAAAVLANLRLSDDLAREIRLGYTQRQVATKFTIRRVNWKYWPRGRRRTSASLGSTASFWKY